MIRKGVRSDVENIIEITKSCAKNMIAQNIYQWNEYYPNKEAFLKDISRDELYVLEIENTLVGCITISTLMDKEYIPISWLTENVNNIYIHRLAIHPTHQGKGYAQELMAFAETFAINNKYISIRLDTFSQTKEIKNFMNNVGINV